MGQKRAENEITILSDMLMSVEKQFIDQLFTKEGLKDYANRLFEDGRFHKEVILAYEDVTWDTVFARLKTDEFFSEHTEIPLETPVSKYFGFVEYVHNMNAKEILGQYPCGAEQLTGLIIVEAWEVFRTHLISYLSKGEHNTNKLINTAKEGLLEGIQAALTKYGDTLEREDTGNAAELFSLLDTTQKVYIDMLENPAALFMGTYAAVVKALEVLICNPEYLFLGDRINSALKYIVAGASVYAGDRLYQTLGAKGFSLKGKIGEQAASFIPALISSIISCILIVLIDEHPTYRQLTEALNTIPTLTGDIRIYRESAERFERIAAELEKLDLDKLQKEIAGYAALGDEIMRIDSAEELNAYLRLYYKAAGKELPWGDRTLEEHWQDSNSRLVFK